MAYTRANPLDLTSAGDNIDEGFDKVDKDLDDIFTNLNAHDHSTGKGGTLVASTISDFDTAVASNSAVAANTAKVTCNSTTVNTAGAVMNTDTTTASMQFVVDEDNMSSNSDTKVPTQQSVKAYVDASIGGSGAVLEADYNANTILAANTDNTPLALTVAENRIVGRKAGGNIDDLTAAEVRTIINVENGADVTDTANVTAAGALMDSDIGTNVQAYDVNTSKTDVAETRSASINMADNVLQRALFKDSAETLVAVGDTGSSHTFDLTAGNVYTATLDQNSTFTFSNPPASGRNGGFLLYLTNGGAFTITWPGAVKWTGGNSPALTASGLDILLFTTNDAGTTWYGVIVEKDLS